MTELERLRQAKDDLISQIANETDEDIKKALNEELAALKREIAFLKVKNIFKK